MERDCFKVAAAAFRRAADDLSANLSDGVGPDEYLPRLQSAGLAIACGTNQFNKGVIYSDASGIISRLTAEAKASGDDGWGEDNGDPT